MVSTETDEARRVELAQAAAGLAKLQKELAAGNAELNAKREKEKRRHERELKKHEQYRADILGTLAARAGRAQRALSELRSFFIDRKILTAEAETKSRLEKLRRGVSIRSAELEAARDAQRQVSKRDKVAGRRLRDDLEIAASELKAEEAKLSEAKHAHSVALKALSVAEAAALQVPKNGDA